ncbi:MAG: gliding motility-associated C-terminal domain-containing protein [Bacteroidota bacterium]
MKEIFWVGFMLIMIHTNGQNLIPNPGFEELARCHLGPGTVSHAVPWYTPNQKSPDLYHTCVGRKCEDDPFVCVPENHYGYQEPKSGDGYAGIYVGYSDTVREYIGVPLVRPLTAGQTYVLTYYLNHADKSRIAIDRMGVHFTDTLLSGLNQLPAPPLLMTAPDLFLDNDEAWIQVRDTFMAAGGEAYMTIGNFFDKDESKSKLVQERGGGPYYFFDDFKLVPIDKNLYIEGDTSICLGESTTLTALNGDSYEWKDSSNLWRSLSSSASLTVSPMETTTYVAYSGICATSITVYVHGPPSLNLQADTLLCEKESLALDVSSSAYQVEYLWQDQSTEPTFLVTEAGDYRVQLSNMCGTVEGSLEVSYESCNCPINFPTAFSPNQDGINDTFFPVYDCEFQTFQWSVFDRWGNLVFQTEDLQASWDGSFQGKQLPAGVYVCVLRYQSEETNRVALYGSVSLFR